MGARMKESSSPVIRTVAGLALSYALGSLLLTGLMAWSWIQGRPITTPVQLLDPGLTLMVPGDELTSPFGGPSWTITRQMVLAAAGLNLAFFLAAGLVWTAAGLGLLGRRRWARLVGIALLSVTVAIGLANLSVEIVMLAMLGGDAGAGGWMGLWVSVSFTLAGLVLMPSAAVTGLLLPSVTASFRAAGEGAESRFSLLAAGLTAHFFLVAALLLLGLLTPDSVLPHHVLLGPWLLAGWAARLASALLGAAHLAAGIGFVRLHRGGYELALWMNVLLTALAVLSALTASDVHLQDWAGGVMPAVAIRWLVLILGLLGAVLVLSVRATRSAFPSPSPSR
jgi:hypothetical protein